MGRLLAALALAVTLTGCGPTFGCSTFDHSEAYCAHENERIIDAHNAR